MTISLPEESESLLVDEDSLLSRGIEDLWRRVIVRDLIHAVIVNLVPEAAESVPSSKELDWKPGGLLSEERTEDRAWPVRERGATSFLGRHGGECLMNGGHLATLSEPMGHESVQTTRVFHAVFERHELRRRHKEFSAVATVARKGKL